MKKSQKGSAVVLLSIIIILLVIVFGVYIYLQGRPSQQTVVVSPSQTETNTQSSINSQNTLPASNIPPVNTSDWQTYTNTQLGLSFQYPPHLNTDFQYVSFNSSPKAFTTASRTPNNQGNGYVDSNGCYYNGSGPASVRSPSLDDQVTINNVSFCASQYAEPAAGQLYTDYYYTTNKNGSYITLDYTVHTPNGCGALTGGDYQACENLNVTTAIIQPIQESVETLKFAQ